MHADPPPVDRSERIRRLVLLALVALVAVVCVGRAIDLARRGWRPTAPGERKWLEWAAGNRWERAVLTALPERPERSSGFGEGRDLVVRVVAGGPVRADWVEVMAQYRWPAHRVLAVEVEGQGRSGPPEGELRAVSEVEIRVSEPEPEPWSAGARSSSGGGPGGRFASAALLLVGVLGISAVAWLGSRTASSRVARLAETVAVAALALFVWKVAEAPLWSWDHFAIWGTKARRIAAVGLHPGWLKPPAFPYSAPDYPLGWPLVTSSLALGRIPGTAVFKLAHLACGIGLVLLVRLAVLRSGAGRLAAATAAALTAASPLLWDTESLGLADLPLALVAVAALVFLLGRSPRSPFHRALSGLLLGLLPWIKLEGWVLSALLLAAAVVLDAVAGGGFHRERLRGLLALALPCGLLWLLQPLFHAPFTHPGISFLAGDWTGRVLARLPELPSILGPMALDLLRPAWLGLWLLFAVVLVLVWIRPRLSPRPWIPRVLGAVVVLQLATYAFVYFATYLDPVAHIDSSFLRIAAALAPLAALTAAIFLGTDTPGTAAPETEALEAPPRESIRA
jgi:hypothetical protein